MWYKYQNLADSNIHSLIQLIYDSQQTAWPVIWRQGFPLIFRVTVSLSPSFTCVKGSSYKFRVLLASGLVALANGGPRSATDYKLDQHSDFYG